MPSPGLIERLVSDATLQVSRLLCAMQGHFMLLHLEPNRVSLRCGLCGCESHGWEVGRPRPAVRVAGRMTHEDRVEERRQALRPLKAGVGLAS